MDMKELALKFAVARCEKRMLIRDLAKEADILMQTVIDIEAGHFTEVTIQDLAKAAHVLGMTLNIWFKDLTEEQEDEKDT